MIRTRSRLIGATAIAAALLFTAACSDDDDGDTASTDTETTAAADSGTDPYGDSGSTEATESTEATDSSEAAAGPTIDVADTDLGSILVDGQGVTLYMFTNDTQGEASTCSGGCSASWPKVTGEATAGEGADDTLLGTVEDEEGGLQVTYDGWPLYYYAEDTAPGDTNGQGVGDVWWVVGADGVPIES